VNKIWSPSPGRNKVVEDLQSLVINNKKRRKRVKKSKDLHLTSPHVPKTAIEKKKRSKISTKIVGDLCKLILTTKIKIDFPFSFKNHPIYFNS